MDNNISPKTHVLMISTEGHPFVENNSVLLQTIKDEPYVYVPLTLQIEKRFGLFVRKTVETLELEVNNEENNASCSTITGNLCGNEKELDEKFQWDNKSTLLMLEVYRKRMPKFRNAKYKKKLLWEDIANIMKQNGYLVGPEAVDKKMRNMKNTFRTILDNNNKKKSTGRGRIQWPYFNIFEDIFKDDKTINIACVMSTTKESPQNTILPEINTISQLVERSSPECDKDIGNIIIMSPSSSSSYDLAKKSSITPAVPTPKINKKCRQLDRWRKRQLELEEEKLVELKRIREAIEKNNEIQEKKILDTLLQNKSPI